MPTPANIDDLRLTDKQRRFSEKYPYVGDFNFKEAELGLFASAGTENIAAKLSKGCRVMGLSMGRFSLIDLIHCVLQFTGPADVSVTTWSAGIKDAANVRWMLDTDLMKSFRLITDHSYVGRKTKYIIPITDLFGKENIRTSRVHAKFVLIGNDNYRFCIRSSMNLNANGTCESFEIDENREIYEFYNAFVDHHFGTQKEGFTRSTATVMATLGKHFQQEEPVEAEGINWFTAE